jgi:hypothetical protein
MIMINRLIQEFDFVKGFEFKRCIKSLTKSKTQQWIAPERDFCKINVDVVDRTSSKGTVAAICRNNQSYFIAASVMVVPNISTRSDGLLRGSSDRGGLWSLQTERGF